MGQHVVGQERRQVQRGVGHPVTDGERGPRCQRVGQDRSPLVGTHRLGEARTERHCTGRDLAEVAADHRQRVVDVEITDHGEHGVARRIVLVEEVLGVVQARRRKLMEVAVAVVGVRERVERDRRERDPWKAAVGAVHDVHPDLFLDDRDLVVQVLSGDPGSAHPVGFQKQGAFQGPGRQQLIVVGVVRVRGPVEHTPGGLHVFGMLSLSDVLAALEHQMFEQVRETGTTFGFRPETHVVVDGHSDDRRRVIRRQHDTQTIGERGFLDPVGGRRQRNGGRVHLGTRGHGWQRYCARAVHGPGLR